MIRINIIFCLIFLFSSCSNREDIIFSDNKITKKWYYDNGQLKKVQDFTLDSIRHGRYLFYYSNKKLADSGYYDNGFFIGDRYSYYENGKQEFTYKYTNRQLRNAIDYDTLGKITSYTSCDYFGNPFFVARYDSLENVINYESSHSSMLLHTLYMQDSIPKNQEFNLEYLVSNPVNAVTEVVIKNWDYDTNDWVFSKKVKPDAYNRVKLKRKHSYENDMYILALASMKARNDYQLEDTLLIHIDKSGLTKWVQRDSNLMKSFFD